MVSLINGVSQAYSKIYLWKNYFISQVLMGFWILRLCDCNLFQYYDLKESTANIIDNKVWTLKHIMYYFNVQTKGYNLVLYFYIPLNNVYFFKILFHKINFSVVVYLDFIWQETLLDYQAFN